MENTTQQYTSVSDFFRREPTLCAVLFAFFFALITFVFKHLTAGWANWDFTDPCYFSYVGLCVWAGFGHLRLARICSSKTLTFLELILTLGWFVFGLYLFVFGVEIPPHILLNLQ